MSRGRFIAIIGPLGVGKTTLARAIADRFGATFVPERFAENPYLTRFYEPGGIERWGFPTEVAFLTQRYDQAMDIDALLAAGHDVVTDYVHYQNLVFARLTLSDEDYATYQSVFDRLLRQAPTPDLLVCLDADVPVLLERIRGRGREMESAIDPDYVARLRAAYSTWRTTPPAPALWLDTNNLAIPQSADARAFALAQIADGLRRVGELESRANSANPAPAARSARRGAASRR